MYRKLGANDIYLEDPRSRRQALAAQILIISDTLADAIGTATELGLAVPPTIADAADALRGWSGRIEEGTRARTLGVDAVRLVAWVRGLPNQRLLTLLLELPSARLSSLLDAVDTTECESPGAGCCPDHRLGDAGMQPSSSPFGRRSRWAGPTWPAWRARSR